MSHDTKVGIKQRAVVKGQLTRLCQNLNTATNPDLSALQYFQDRLHELLQKFNEAQDKITQADPEADIDASWQEFEMVHGQCDVKIRRLIKQLEAARDRTASANSRDSPATVVSSSGTQSLLPKIHIKPFDGSFAEWHSFHDTFKSLVHDNDMPAVHKFHLLKSYLIGDASAVVDSINATAENYLVAWNALQKRCNRPRKIIQGHIRALFELPELTKYSAHALRGLIERAEMHVNALKSLQQPAEWHEMLIFIVTSKLDNESRTAWERSVDDEKLPTFDELLSFLNKHSRDSEPVALTSKQLSSNTKDKSHPSHADRTTSTKFGVRTRSQNSYISTQSKITCPVCNENHFIYSCSTFLNLTPQDRLDAVRKAKLCVNCLRSGHSTFQCRGSSCRKCQKRHNSLIHFEAANATKVQAPNQTPEAPVSGSSSQPVALTSISSSEILLSTARIYILDKFNKRQKCRVLLDPGSQQNFMTETFAERLQLPKTLINIPASGLGLTKAHIKYSVNATIQVPRNEFTSQATFLALPTITSMLPSQQIDRASLEIPANLQLADPEFHRPGTIDALLGEYLFYRLLSIGQIRLPNQRAVLQKTRLGWIVSGEVDVCPNILNNMVSHVAINELNDNLTKFWELEECSTTPILSPQEIATETHFIQNIQRSSDGRYTVRLPFNSKQGQLGNSYQTALRRFYSLERRLNQDPEQKRQYSEFLSEYAQLAHMTDITNTDNTKDGYYLPHHAVLKQASLTTKTRVVFDASAKSSTGISLNDTLMIGGKLQEDIFPLILRFRTHRFVLTADIEKMFRQIKIHADDVKFQKILWRNDTAEPIKVYQLNTVTYGTACAPFLAVRCLQRLAEDDGDAYPLAAAALKSDFYMDDVLTGADTLNDARELRDQLLTLTRRGGFSLRQWVSNNQELINGLPERSTAQCLALDSSNTQKTLGIFWHAERDEFTYTVNLPNDTPRITKRIILSEIARLFDPQGLLGPIIIRAKILIQTLWKSKLHWDETIPPYILHEWKTYKQELNHLRHFAVPRRILVDDPIDIQLHGFCDASERAYGACLYLRTSDINGKIISRLVCAKSRVAPLKTISLPRLELCAAELLTSLYQVAVRAMKLPINKTRFWSDSTITLHWLRTPPHTLKTFVANRVAKIQNRTTFTDWAHVCSSDNPADFISRGQDVPRFLHNSLWSLGPDWLRQPEGDWPQLQSLPTIEIPERRPVITLISCSDTDMFNRFSSFTTLVRVIAYCLKFKQRALTKIKGNNTLSPYELKNAHNRIILLIQENAFARELIHLRLGRNLEEKSKIIPLNPFLDSDGIIRVGGRLKHATLPYSQKHPILLPRSNHVSRLVIQNSHLQNMHAGVQATLNSVRSKYWPIDGRNTTRHIIKKCITCFRAKPPNNQQYIMGNLPKDRINAVRPFLNVGIDYCGPFFIKEKKYRNQKKLKVYVAVFVCLVTRAIHLELVSDLTTEAFIAALRRFFARRGVAEQIYTDNGTNFVGANNEFKEIQSLVQSDSHNQTVGDYLSKKGITWHFTPPRAPHFGGIWEAGVKSFKHHLVRTIGETLLTFEHLNTYVVEIEAILNSRPLTPLSSDPNDFSPLTPGHFLIGDALTNPLETDFLQVPSNKLSTWQHLQKMRQHFWNRWHKEYLQELTVRSKWHTGPAQEIKLGTLVLLREDNLPPMRWALGRILKVHPGDDGVTRVVTVKTTNGVYTRSVKKICPLPLEEDPPST